MKTLPLVFCVLTILLAGRVSAQIDGKFYVEVDVIGYQSNSITSYVNRELRGLNDVLIDENLAQIILHIDVGDLIESRTGKPSIFYASVSICSRHASCEEFVGQMAVADTDLKKLAESIVTSFDSEVLEPGRKAYSRRVLGQLTNSFELRSTNSWKITDSAVTDEFGGISVTNKFTP